MYDVAVDPVTNETVLVEGTNESLVLGVHLEPTDFRVNPLYTVYFNWSRLIVLGIIPFSMLVYLNLKIYQVAAANPLISLSLYQRCSITYVHDYILDQCYRYPSDEGIAKK